MAKAGKRPEAPSIDVKPSGKFVLRTPLLPRDELERWGAAVTAPSAIGDPKRLAAALDADRKVLRDRLRAIVARPEVREAIFVASPGLEESIDQWLADPTSERGEKTERSLVRYVSRMCARPTPFGLFAGNTIGELGTETHLELAPRETYRRYTRIDGDFLSDLTDTLTTDRSVRDKLPHRPNSSLCRVAGRLRYAMRREGASRSYSLVSLEPSDYLVATLQRAKDGALPEVLAQALCDADAEVTREDADGFIEELIASQVLVSDLAPPVTGPEAVDDVIAQLAAIRDSDIARVAAETLDTFRSTLAELDHHVGNAPTRYRAAAETLAPLPAKAELNRLFQVNLVPAGARVELGTDVLDEIVRAIGLLRRMARPRGADDLSRFRDAFYERYETKELPLTEVLDEESGIGFAASQAPSSAASPLLEGLFFPGTPGEETTAWGARVAYLARRIHDAVGAGADEIVIDEADLTAMDVPKELQPTPDVFQAMFSLARTPEGEPRISISSVGGPPGASLLGRFCHSDPAMHEVVRANIAAEEALRPDAVFAEVVHLADGRLANISARPVLRGHEIVYLGRSGAPRDQQIPVDDLYVSVRDGRVVLRSHTLGREVIPRLTNAHNFSAGALGTYRFLASLQSQGQRGMFFNIGPLGQLPYVPRVRYGRVVLREASWTLRKSQLDPITSREGAARMQALAELRAATKLPRWVCVEDGDNVLPVDLENILSVDSFAHLVKSRPAVTLTELWPPSESLCVHGPDGRYANEIVVPFVRVPAEVPRMATPVPHSRGRRTFAPGSEWLYVKLYTGHATSDQILTEAIAPIVKDLPHWFFIRYGDPQWHVRFRVRGEPAQLYGQVLPQLAELTRAMLDDGRMWRMQLDTYERELERYGGPVGIELAERWFHVDSACVIDILGMLAGDAGMDARWRLCVRAIDQLFDDFGIDLAQRHLIMSRTRDSFAREHNVESAVAFQRALGDKYRKERIALEALLDRNNDAESDLSPGLERIALRSEHTAPIVADLRAAQLTMPLADLLPSYIHMHANRLIRSAQRAHELVMYDLLTRLYEGKIARSKSKKA